MEPTQHFVVIGAQRSGTTYLREQLDAHPQITMARPATPEPKVFLDDTVLTGGREEYLRSFFGHAGPGQLLGEKSTSYLERPDAIGRMKAVLGRPRIVVQLRDPLARAVSNWRFSTDNGYETRPLDDALESELAGELPAPAEGVSVSPFAYLGRGRYAEQLRPWAEAFGDDLLVVFFADLIVDPDSLGALYERLGVDPRFRPAGFGARVNSGPDGVEGISAELTSRLREHFAGPDVELAELIGRAPQW
ncbi:MAG: sulfotransferase [Actinomycetota bacterium]|nr:sulfotransferase [Actinomycetota bacterium]